MYDRITSNPGILGGKPVISGTRLSVEFVLEYMASGGTIQKFVESYPHVSEEDVKQAMLFAANRVRNEVESTVRIPA